MACPVCAEDLGGRTEATSCPYCKYTACQPCVRKYLLGRHEDAHCMSCRTAWGREQLVALLGERWVSGPFKLHRQEVLYERERSRVPDVQERVRVMYQCERLRARYAANLVKVNAPREQEELQLRIRRLRHATRLPDSESESEPDSGERVVEFLRALFARKARMSSAGKGAAGDADAQEAKPQRRHHPMAGAGGGAQRQPRDALVMACPADGCRGFLRNSRCGLCSTAVCSRCFATPGPGEHTCDEADLALAREIVARTKPCPACGVRIFKVKESGCDQMWCTSCHTCFSWSRLQILRDVQIHSPHCFEWQMRRGDAGPAPARACGDCDAEVAIMRAHGGGPPTRELMDVLRLARHVRDPVNQPGWGRAVVDGSSVDQRDALIMQYLAGVIDEKAHKRRLQELEKRRLKELHLREVWDMFSAAALDVLRQCEPGTGERQLAELRELRSFTNEAFERVQRLHSCVVPVVDEAWRQTTKPPRVRKRAASGDADAGGE